MRGVPAAILMSCLVPLIAHGEESPTDREDQFAALLFAERWEEAGEVENVPDIVKVVNKLWNAHAAKGAAEQERFRQRLLLWVFRYTEFADFWNSPYNHFGQFIDLAAKLDRRLLPENEVGLLDLTDLDLYREVAEKTYNGNSRWKNQDLQRVFAALRARPDSIPAVAALMCLLQKCQQTTTTWLWVDAEAHLLGPFGKVRGSLQKLFL